MKRLVLFTSILTIIIFSATSVYMQSNAEISGITSTFSKAAAAPRVLYWGSRGDDVRKVQERLKRWDYYNGAVDGIYGSRTYRAVRSFQRNNGLAVDGIVGPKTAAAIGITLGGAKGVSRSVSRNDDVYLLARAVYGEARGEPYIGQVAVAAVVLNRVEHASFPNSIASVIYQPGAFTAVSDGQINLTPSDEAIKAAKDALNGWDPTYGCRFYWNPATATSKWIWSREVVIKIGKHWFGN